MYLRIYVYDEARKSEKCEYNRVHIHTTTNHIARAVEKNCQTLDDVHVDLILAAAAFRWQHRDGDIGCGGGLRYTFKRYNMTK